MKCSTALAVFGLALASPVLNGAQNQAREMEAAGEVAGARAALARAVEAQPNSIPALNAYTEFLDQYGDPASREAYSRLLAALERSGNKARAGIIARRLTALDLLAGDREAAARDAEAYRTATGKSLALPGVPPPASTSAPAGARAPIPGPLRSFARMAAISPEAGPEEILPALARNVVTNGYEASHSNEALEQTEYLKLVHRYISQARELDKLAGEEKVIKIPSCDAPNVADLIRILGFRMRGGCGSEVVLETVNASRAFLTTDSGFPVDKLEEALRTNRPFRYDFHPTQVPVLFGPEYWMAGSKDSDFLGNFIGDPANCRLYLGLSKLDRETADALRKQGAYTHLKAYAHVLDFFGAMFELGGGVGRTGGRLARQGRRVPG